MNTRKSLKLPIVITVLVIIVIVYLFTNIKQSKVICEKVSVYENSFKITEKVTATTDGKKITSINVIKTIYIPDRYYGDFNYLKDLKESLSNTLEYLDNNVSFEEYDDKIVVSINVSKDELVLLDNIKFVSDNGNMRIIVNPNTKSTDVIALSVGDNYNDSVFMKLMRDKGYTCK